MTILAGDIKLVASQVMSDASEGGGAPTSTVIADGTSNSIFTDISELDRAGGRVNLRKVFANVQTANTDSYLGANVIVADAPDDPLVSVTIFKANSTFDVRTDARNRIESYLTKGSAINGFLLEDHIAGQRAIRIFQRPGAELPAVGATLYLVAGNVTQYVRVTSVASVLQTFTASTGSSYIDYVAQVVNCGLSDALLFDFSGSPPSRTFSASSGKTAIFSTFVADAGAYYGAVPTTAPITLGSVSADVKSIYTQLVPSAQTETPLIDMTAGGTSQALIAAGTNAVSYTTTAPFSALTALSFGSPVLPGSLAITYTGGSMSDDSGDIKDGTTVVGSINYEAGTGSFLSSAPTYSGSKTVSFKPAAAPLRIADTLGIAVTIEGRSYNYVQTINPPPAPGTLQVSYYAQGAWYTLRDLGSGKLSGSDSAYGVGTVNYSTGTVSVTLGALPDVGSEIVYAWGGKANYFDRSALVPSSPRVSFTLGHTGITPGSLLVAWNDGIARTATDNGAGKITGGATGEINYSTGAVTLVPATLPLGGQQYDVSYTWGDPTMATFPEPARNGDGSLTIDLGETDLKPGTIELSWNLALTNYSFLSNTPAEMQHYDVTRVALMDW